MEKWWTRPLAHYRHVSLNFTYALRIGECVTVGWGVAIFKEGHAILQYWGGTSPPGFSSTVNRIQSQCKPQQKVAEAKQRQNFLLTEVASFHTNKPRHVAIQGFDSRCTSFSQERLGLGA